MENSRSSFIPKQTTAAASRTRTKKRHNVLGMISSVLLVAALVLAGGMYFLKYYATNELKTAKEELVTESNRFNESDIAAVRELDRKLKAAQYLLDTHLAPSKLFSELELSTKETIQFTSFEYEAAEGSVSLTLAGATEEFVSVALQKLQFGDAPILRNAIFTKLSTNEAIPIAEEGIPQSNLPEVSFTVIGAVTPALLVYDNTTASAPTDIPEFPEDAFGTSTGSTADEFSDEAPVEEFNPDTFEE